MNTLKEFEAWLTKTQNVAFDQTRDAADKVYTEFTKPGDTSEADYRSVDRGAGLGQMGFTPLGGANHRDTYKPGTERVTTWKKFTTSVILPEEMIEDMYNNGRVKKDKVKLFSTISDDFNEVALWTKEIMATDFITRGNSTTVTATYPGTFRDGLALASSAHTTLRGGTWSNLQTGSALTQQALLDGLTLLANVPTEEGRAQGNIGDVLLIHGRAQMFAVDVLLGTATKPGTDHNDVNPLARKMRGFGRILPVLDPHLPSSFTGWALLDAKNHKLLFFEKKQPTLSKDTDINNGNRVNRCVMRVAIDADSAKGYVLNPGV